ncbi:hypothetical protein FJ987_02760 [Mesorhizobium sp. CU2]|uniref:ATP-binding protein n=1 Tax=unclassified Mesorhizobium TaxID=325217 RepID=UPI00112773F6|nr:MULTISPECIES: ATP-binding protein [unclassified Mesorhizobium]TPN84174.1 hypothetical protein FJ988_11145 [Mesorhizobium sp. CU3]TPO21120.1 hypothetical protein FJ987_02760 [Mesorhizobium sp. CU2]
MTTTPQKIKLRSAPITAVARDEIRLGKDVIELVSTAMYVEPMTVYREYIQNASDSIDAARANGLLTDVVSGQIDINIDLANRSIRIRDNGVGVATADFASRLTTLGASKKRGTGARGFRGVGRLVGLGQAQELVFRSRAIGQDDVSELRWDCRRLKTILADPAFDGDVGDLIAEVVSLRHLPGSDYPLHFFEVELSKVIRQRSDKLMNAAMVADYLMQVAPIPFSSEFRFAGDILAALQAVTKPSEIEIRINGGEPLRKPHQDTFLLAPGKTNAFEELSLVEIPGMEGGIAAIGWFLHHEYDGALPVATLIKGVRLRIGNLQIGDHTILEEMFPESRFNAWSVGEIHVFDPRIVPNGRRDHFEQNSHFSNLLNHLAPPGREIARRCRTNSARRSKLREFDLLEEEVRGRLEILRQGALGRAQRKVSVLAIEATLLRLDKLANLDSLSDVAVDLERRIVGLRAALTNMAGEAEANGGPLERLPAPKRAMYEHMVELIYDCSTNRKAAKALIDRIIQKVATS